MRDPEEEMVVVVAFVPVTITDWVEDVLAVFVTVRLNIALKLRVPFPGTSLRTAVPAEVNCDIPMSAASSQ
jgi:hypothetical protein